MRTYIFTDAERDAIQLFLARKIRSSDSRVAHVLSRIRNFSDLSSDVRLYIKISVRLAESKPT